MLSDGIAAVAARIRESAGETDAAYSTRRMVDAVFPDAVVTGRRLPAGVQEVAAITAKGPIILYSRDLSPPAQRFVIAHALGHLLWDAGPGHGRARPGYAGDPAVEKRADAFAAELLVPLTVLAGLVDLTLSPGGNDYLDQVDAISSHFNVPRSLIDKRIREVHR